MQSSPFERASIAPHAGLLPPPEPPLPALVPELPPSPELPLLPPWPASLPTTIGRTHRSASQRAPAPSAVQAASFVHAIVQLSSASPQLIALALEHSASSSSAVHCASPSQGLLHTPHKHDSSPQSASRSHSIKKCVAPSVPDSMRALAQPSAAMLQRTMKASRVIMGSS
jgi:hypothetical protein